MRTDAFVEVWPGASRPEISILMPIYRQPRYVRDAVNSVLAQREVVAEIIISDDASADETFETAWLTVQEWLARHGSQHRIVMRRGIERLWRDHLPLLVDNAACDVVCQAHGDDESHPDRARIIVAAFRNVPRATLMGSEASIIDEAGKEMVAQRPVDLRVALARYSYESIIDGHDCLVGFSLAWRRSGVSSFKRLDRNFAAVGHDRILPFRAALAGEVYLVQAQLVRRRDHAMAAHKLMFDEPETEGLFGWSLAWVTHLMAMAQDLEHARQAAMVSNELYRSLANTIARLSSVYAQRLVEGYRRQLRSGRQIAWVDDATMLALCRERIAR